MDAMGETRASLLRTLESELRGAHTPADVGLAFSACVASWRAVVLFDQATLLASERNREWISVVAEHPGGHEPQAPRPAREVGYELVGGFPEGIEFVPATSNTAAAREMTESGIAIAWASPLIASGGNHGMISVARRSEEHFEADELAFLSQVAAAFARRLARHNVQVWAGQEAARRELVSEICRWPDGEEEPQELLDRVFPIVERALPASAIVLVANEGAGESRELGRSGDASEASLAASGIPRDASLTPADAGGEPGHGRTVNVPLLRGDETIGTVALSNSSAIPYGQGDLAFLNFLSTVLGQALVSRMREAQLRAAERRYQHLFHAAPAMYVIARVESSVPLVIDCNELFLATLGYAREEVIGSPLSKFDPSERRAPGPHVRLLANDEERHLVDRGGQVIDTLLRTTPDYGPSGEIVSVCAMYIDVSERNGLQRQLAHQAFHDALTDLPNRVLFLDRLEQAIRRKSRVAVGLLDLDDFKVVNDSLGHASGDALLVAVARRLRDFLMPVDTIARMGGDEFTILLEDPGSPEEAVARMEALAQAFDVPFKLGERDVFVDASIGLIVDSGDELGAEELLRRADVAMYEAKRRGKGAVQLFDSSFQDLARHRLDLETDLRHAIDNGEIIVWYQPVVNLDTGELAEVEALARWQHPVRGILPPAEFIDLAEESGLIVSLGHEVLLRACRDARTWLDTYDMPSGFRVAVNASVKELERPHIVDEILAVLEQTGLRPQFLKIEVTESLMMTDGDGAISKLERLAAAGIGIAIDDFGTGYSSLSYLKRLPVDTVKIDRSFVSGIEVEVRDTAIVQAVVAFAERIGMTVTVEGVETQSQVTAVRNLGANHAQGYFFSKPMAPEMLVAQLKAKKTAA